MGCSLVLHQRWKRRDFVRDPASVAQDLVGALLVHHSSPRLVLRLVEVEAYLGVGEDPASHAHRGPTPRNSQMFATPGRFYVYVSYGIHHCLNVVCATRGRAGAVLLRAAEPLEGGSVLQQRRARAGVELCNGPGKLGEALGADLSWNGLDLVRGEWGIWPGPSAGRVSVSPRIGIRRARQRLLRFYDAESRWVSRGRFVR